MDDFLLWATLGVILGGRLGYVLFYRPDYYLANPIEILAVWQGGMAFTVASLGVTVAGIIFVRRRGIAAFGRSPTGSPAPRRSASFSAASPTSLMPSWWGRTADVPWAMVFPRGGPLARHPSQLYQAALEGALLFLVLYFLQRRDSLRARPGLLAGVFIGGYGIVRIAGEMFREPDAHIGLLALGTTWGQWLSLPMVAIGGALIARSRR